MITSSDPASRYALPLHRLTSNEIKLWLAFPLVRRAYAANLVRVYREGCALISPTMYLFAMVTPRGDVRELQPPYHAFEKWQLANQPTITKCACADFYDPENNAPWRERKSPEHHPLCEWDRTVRPVFKESMERAKRNLNEGKHAQERPDDWVKIRQQVREVLR